MATIASISERHLNHHWIWRSVACTDRDCENISCREKRWQVDFDRVTEKINTICDFNGCSCDIFRRRNLFFYFPLLLRIFFISYILFFVFLLFSSPQPCDSHISISISFLVITYIDWTVLTILTILIPIFSLHRYRLGVSLPSSECETRRRHEEILWS